MGFLSSIPYELGSAFEENNIDLKLRNEFDNNVNFYSSYRYSEVYLFGKVFESVCYLWFTHNMLSRIEYRFEIKYYELFKECINKDLPEESKLEPDPFVKGNPLEGYSGNLIIGLDKLSKNFFILKIELHPRKEPMKSLYGIM
ncbi:hypothetical protein [Seonamhaeicola sp. ML3]|uniref:hypothetical protein n=1 Tax=Seonamhaeicola sp. ML3 TaxID=2937786 RepID=UPI00200FC795|nr:hypothetical protein [Seonamhaeicola sp. ML3]